MISDTSPESDNYALTLMRQLQQNHVSNEARKVLEAAIALVGDSDPSPAAVKQTSQYIEFACRKRHPRYDDAIKEFDAASQKLYQDWRKATDEATAWEDYAKSLEVLLSENALPVPERPVALA